MKKALFVTLCIVSSAFFASAQLQVGDVRVNVGQVTGKLGGNTIVTNPSTGQVRVFDNKGRGISVDDRTGQVGIAGSIAGIRFGGIFGGLFGGSGNGSNSGVGGVGFQGGISGRNGGIMIGNGGALGGGLNVGACLVGWEGVCRIIAMVQLLVTRAVPLLIGVALLAFFWFLIEFIWKGREDPAHYAKAKSGMIWSIVAIFVMVSIWGLVGFIGGVLGINQGGSMHGFKLPGEQ